MRKWNRFRELLDNTSINIPNGKSGNWSVSTFEVSEQDEKFGELRAMISSSSRGRYVPKGIYKALKCGSEIVMSNTPDEVRDQQDFLEMARGRILINGLVLGFTLMAALNKVDAAGNPVVKDATVIEISKEVIELVGPSFSSDDRVHIINADAMKYKADGKFDAAWHDIWSNICADNLNDMHRLHRKYGNKTKWQGSWCRDVL